ncbi:MAG: AAA family ATPase [Candidatus Heimdallarchaeota archaeon]|nr:AAA family ATPase [Candidatus Heimdallarchaeota archaeon]
MQNTSDFTLYITGIPGTGKTTVAKELVKRLKMHYLEINTEVLEQGFYYGYDITRDSVIIDEELLIPHLEGLLKLSSRNCLVGPLIPLSKHISLIIILRTHIPNLRKRLEARNYNTNKIEENIEAEIMNILYYDAIEFFPENMIFEVQNNDCRLNETCDEVISIIRQHDPSVLIGFID